MSAAAALGGSGFDVDLYEARSSWAVALRPSPWRPPRKIPWSSTTASTSCCGAATISLISTLAWESPIVCSSRASFTLSNQVAARPCLRRGVLPPPFHFTGAFLGLKFLSLADKLAIARGMLAIQSEHATRTDLDQITMLDWLHEKRQTPGAIERYWRQVLVSAVNEELDRMAAAHGFQIFWLGFLAAADAYEMGVPTIPLGDLYADTAWRQFERVAIHLRTPVESVDASGCLKLASGATDRADFTIICLPPDRLNAVAPTLNVDTSWVEYSPITGIHLWFDRPVTDLPHATLLDRTLQWMFNKSEGRYLQLVVSASRSLTNMPKADVIALAVRELAEFFPAVKDAKLERAHVIKELRATFSAGPGLEKLRPVAATSTKNIFLAGDWTRSGSPAT